MRIRSVFTGLILLLFGLMNANAQGFHIGAKAGMNINKIDGRAFTDQAEYGISAGGFAQIDFAKKWGIQPEILWNQSKTTTTNDPESVITGAFQNQDITLNYLTIPILLSYRPVPVLSLMAGPQFGILLNQTNFVDGVTDAFKKGDFSLVGGAQVNLGGFLVGARYYIGLTNLNDVTNNDKWTNQGIQAYIGFRIF